MNIPCERCGHAHDLPEAAIPLYGARVRCTGCGQLFDVPGRDGSPITGPQPVGGDRYPRLPVDADGHPSNSDHDFELPAGPHVEVEIEAANGVDPELEAKRLARVLLTDVVYADPERFEAARREGRVLAEYAAEIARAWASYQHRVGAAYAASSTHFRRALADVMSGDGGA